MSKTGNAETATKEARAAATRRRASLYILNKTKATDEKTKNGKVDKEAMGRERDNQGRL